MSTFSLYLHRRAFRNGAWVALSLGHVSRLSSTMLNLNNQLTTLQADSIHGATIPSPAISTLPSGNIRFKPDSLRLRGCSITIGTIWQNWRAAWLSIHNTFNIHCGCFALHAYVRTFW